MTKIILLDIDGVLVHPGGYRAALRATMNHFFNLMGLPPFDIPEENLTELEKRGISSEWDMVPLLLASIWTESLRQQPRQNLPSSVSTAAVEIGRHPNGYKPLNIHVPMFELTAGQYPAESALKQNLFSSIPMDLRMNILHKTRDVHFSQTMRFFQHFTLGSEKFAETYHLPREIETESLLLVHDTSNINNEIRSKLLQPGSYPVAFTARPSAPPREVEQPVIGYAPEAELALDLVGLPHIPLMAFGKLEYLASQRGLDPVTLLKPAPFQALAAALAAWTGEEWSSLQCVCDWLQSGEIKQLLHKLPKQFELIVIEDTLSGIRSTRSAGEILQKAGLDITIRPLGLASNSPVQSAFEQANVEYFESWDSLINAIR